MNEMSLPAEDAQRFSLLESEKQDSSQLQQNLAYNAAGKVQMNVQQKALILSKVPLTKNLFSSTFKSIQSFRTAAAEGESKKQLRDQSNELAAKVTTPRSILQMVKKNDELSQNLASKTAHSFNRHSHLRDCGAVQKVDVEELVPNNKIGSQHQQRNTHMSRTLISERINELDKTIRFDGNAKDSQIDQIGRQTQIHFAVPGAEGSLERENNERDFRGHTQSGFFQSKQDGSTSEYLNVQVHNERANGMIGKQQPVDGLNSRRIFPSLG